MFRGFLFASLAVIECFGGRGDFPLDQPLVSDQNVLLFSFGLIKTRYTMAFVYFQQLNLLPLIKKYLISYRFTFCERNVLMKM